VDNDDVPYDDSVLTDAEREAQERARRVSAPRSDDHGRTHRRTSSAPPPSGPPEPPGLITRTAASITEEPVDWLWPDRIPLGMVSLIDGDPGLGKSLITLALSACISTGMPIVPGVPAIGPAGVMILAAEDDPARTITPRLRAAGADLERVHIVDGLRTRNGIRPVRFPVDIPVIRESILENEVRLVVIDPIMGFLNAVVDAHKEQSIRDVLAGIKQLAEETEAAVVMIRHLNKKAGEAAIYRGGDSIAFTAAARSALVVGKVPNRPGVFALAVAKCNLVPAPPAIAYSIECPESVPVIGWAEELNLSADDLLPATPPRRGQKQEDAEDCLKEQLVNGSIDSTEVLDRGRGAGYSESTIRRAADSLGVEKHKSSFGGPWRWSLPSKMTNLPAEEGEVTIFDETSGKHVDTPEDGQSDFREQFRNDDHDGFVEGEL
jgi:hypothetical protein